MNYKPMIRTASLAKVNIDYAVKFLVLLGLATAAPLVGLYSQWITGPIVNMALILSVFFIGIRAALLIGILPSTIALGSGLLPAVLAPMIPFIIISNTLLVLVIDWFKNQRMNYFTALFFAAGIKYLFLLITSGLVINLILKPQLASKVALMMSWPQFMTALVGGMLAWGVLKILKK